MERDVAITPRRQGIFLQRRNVAVPDDNVGMRLGGEAQLFELENSFVSIDCLDHQRRPIAWRKGAPEGIDHGNGILAFMDAEEIKAKEESKSVGQTKVAAGKGPGCHRLEDGKAGGGGR